jgi:hypothetical protein
MPDDLFARGRFPREVAAYLRKRVSWVRAMIASGELKAVNTAPRGARPRFVVLPDQLAEFVRGRQTVPPPKRMKRPKRTNLIDFYP